MRSSLVGGEVSTIAVVKIGRRVRDERVKQFWTQERLASAAGISQKALSKIENDEVEPRFSTILKLAEALGIEPSKLADIE
jgi:transcriptional regulator with XRE-family HTH domain